MPSFIQYFRKIDLTVLKTMPWRTEREQGMRDSVEEMRGKGSMSAKRICRYFSENFSIVKDLEEKCMTSNSTFRIYTHIK